MIEKKLANAAAKEESLENGSAKLSDLPIQGSSTYLRRFDPYVPSFMVTILFWGLYLVFTLIGLLYGLWAGVLAAAMYLTFRPRAFRYEGPRPLEKEFSFSDAIRLDDVKTIQKAFKSKKRHITLNDVMCAVVSKAIRNHCDSVGEKPDSR